MRAMGVQAAKLKHNRFTELSFERVSLTLRIQNLCFFTFFFLFGGCLARQWFCEQSRQVVLIRSIRMTKNLYVGLGVFILQSSGEKKHPILCCCGFRFCRCTGFHLRLQDPILYMKIPHAVSFYSSCKIRAIRWQGLFKYTSRIYIYNYIHI